MQRDCPPATEGNLPDFERAQWYCREGEDRKIVSNGYYTIPQEDSALDHRENQLPCPAHYHCNNGIAKPKLLWAESTGCASSVVGRVQSVELDIPEDTTPAFNLPSGWTFLAVTNGLQGATIKYGISLCANGCNGGLPRACGQGFSPFDMGLTDGKLGITQELDAESCTEPYILQITANAVDINTDERRLVVLTSIIYSL